MTIINIFYVSEKTLINKGLWSLNKLGEMKNGGLLKKVKGGFGCNL